MTISKKWPVQFLKQTLEERLFAAYMLRVKTHSVLAVGESCCRAVQKQGGCTTACYPAGHNSPCSKGGGRQLNTVFQFYCLHNSPQLM